MKKSFTFFLIFFILPELFGTLTKGAGISGQMDRVNKNLTNKAEF